MTYSLQNAYATEYDCTYEFECQMIPPNFPCYLCCTTQIHTRVTVTVNKTHKHTHTNTHTKQQNMSCDCMYAIQDKDDCTYEKVNLVDYHQT
jgi:hypothetical protein